MHFVISLINVGTFSPTHPPFLARPHVRPALYPPPPIVQVIRAVVITFCNVPKVAYDCTEKIEGDIAGAGDPGYNGGGGGIGGDGGGDGKNVEGATEAVR